MPPTIANGKVCYVEIPADNVERSSTFYRNSFGWNIRKRHDGHLAFDDTTGEVSGAWEIGRKAHADPDMLVHIMVDDIDATIKAIITNGGKIVRSVGADAPEITARFTDPFGNVFGLYQEPQSFVIERALDTPVERVWKAITDRDEMKRWYFDLKEFKLEAGFEFDFSVENGGAKWIHRCKITAAVPLEKLAYTWRYDGYSGSTLVTFELFPDGKKTKVKLTHAGLNTFPDIPGLARKNFEEGWTMIIGKNLREFVEQEE